MPKFLMRELRGGYVFLSFREELVNDKVLVASGLVDIPESLAGEDFGFAAVFRLFQPDLDGHVHSPCKIVFFRRCGPAICALNLSLPKHSRGKFQCASGNCAENTAADNRNQPDPVRFQRDFELQIARQFSCNFN